MSADTLVDLVPFQALIGPGNQDVVGAFGGATPKGAVVFLSGCTTSGTACVHARLSVGAYDGAYQFFTAIRETDAQTSSDSDSWQDDTAAAIAFNADRTVDCLLVASFVPNGVKLTQATGCDAAWRGAVLLLGGSDMLFKAGTFTAPGTIGTSVTVTPGFRAEWGMMLKTRQDNLVDAGRSSAILMQGLFINHATDGVKNFGLSYESDNNLAAKEGYVRVQNNSLWELDVGGANEGQMTAHTFAATTFQVRNDDTGNVGQYLYFAATTGGALDFHAEQYDSPAGADAGPTPETSPAFAPALSVFWTSLATAVNTTSAGSEAASSAGVSLYDGSDTFTASVCAQDGISSQSNVRSLAHNQVALLGVDPADVPAGCQSRLTATPSHTALGTDLDFTDNPATARRWIYFALAGGTPAPGPPGTRRRGFLW